MKHHIEVSMRDIRDIEYGRFRAMLKVILDNKRMSENLMNLTGLNGNKRFLMTIVLLGNSEYVDKVFKPAVENIAKINAMRIVDERPTIEQVKGGYYIVVNYDIEWDDYSEDKEEG